MSEPQRAADRAALQILAVQYVDRAEHIAAELGAQLADVERRASRILAVAKEAHKMGKYRDAIDKFIFAAQLFLNGAALATKEDRRAALRSSAELAVAAAEQLKANAESVFFPAASREADGTDDGALRSTSPVVPRAQASPSGAGGPGRKAAASVGSGSFGARESDAGGGKGSLSEAELAVLRDTSQINHRLYVPFLPADLHEPFVLGRPFVDPDGPLALAPKQAAAFCRWGRAADLSVVRASTVCGSLLRPFR